MQTVRKLCLGVAGVACLLLIAGLAMRDAMWWQPAAVVMCTGLAIGFGAIPALMGFQFTAWIIAAVTAAMIYPDHFLQVGDINLRNPQIILTIIQAVMFGMGTQMSLKDFAGIVKMPWAVFVGIFCQFTIMPLVGYTLARTFDFPDEIAAGLILIGSCSSGLASNVMVYLARGNLALSITLTSASTLLAPVVTPLWMKTLAGELVQVDGFKMMMDIVRMVLVPIAAALVHDFLKHASRSEKRLVWSTAVLGALWFTFLALAKFGHLPLSIPLQFAAWNEGVSLLSGAVVVGTLYHALTLLLPWLDRRMPLVSMFGIIYFTVVTTAAGREDLLKIGGLLFLAAVIHNAAGYCFGYWLSRGMGMDRTAARTVAFEVGLQNGGMASGLAGLMGKLGTVGLAAAIFSPWMNVSGSILANYWRKHPTDADETNVASA